MDQAINDKKRTEGAIFKKACLETELSTLKNAKEDFDQKAMGEEMNTLQYKKNVLRARKDSGPDFDFSWYHFNVNAPSDSKEGEDSPDGQREGTDEQLLEEVPLELGRDIVGEEAAVVPISEVVKDRDGYAKVLMRIEEPWSKQVQVLRHMIQKVESFRDSYIKYFNNASHQERCIAELNFFYHEENQLRTSAERKKRDLVEKLVITKETLVYYLG
ncbi:hypothetical protein NE237_027726 [Protea cynaroides]|uniref:Uncharacterized protein n=1 Tax=Protea cynaroides TaxID=273540 RepID=A0A9Q0GP33_9MAGN|nr:hypothetical protein NE237_027726 [Protea cynaroides]